MAAAPHTRATCASHENQHEINRPSAKTAPYGEQQRSCRWKHTVVSPAGRRTVCPRHLRPQPTSHAHMHAQTYSEVHYHRDVVHRACATDETPPRPHRQKLVLAVLLRGVWQPLPHHTHLPHHHHLTCSSHPALSCTGTEASCCFHWQHKPTNAAPHVKHPGE